MNELKDAGVELTPPATDAGTDSQDNVSAPSSSDAGCVIDYPVMVHKGLAEEIANCRIAPGFQMYFYYSPEDLEEERRLNGDGEVKKHGGVRMADKAKVEHEEVAAPMESVAPEEASATESGGGDEQAIVSVPSAPIDPASAVGDVQKIMEQAGGANGYAVILSLVAVAGGGAGWKFYQNFAKQRHEQKMKALEIEQSKVEKNDGDHKACDAKNAALVARVEELAGKLAAVEAKAGGGGIDVEGGLSSEAVEDLEKRLKALENWKKRGAKK